MTRTCVHMWRAQPGPWAQPKPRDHIGRGWVGVGFWRSKQKPDPKLESKWPRDVISVLQLWQVVGQVFVFRIKRTFRYTIWFLDSNLTQLHRPICEWALLYTHRYPMLGTTMLSHKCNPPSPPFVSQNLFSLKLKVDQRGREVREGRSTSSTAY